MHIDVIKLWLINDHIGCYSRLCKSQFEETVLNVILHIHVTDVPECGRQVNLYYYRFLRREEVKNVYRYSIQFKMRNFKDKFA